MQKTYYIIRYQDKPGKSQKMPLAYSHDIDEVRDFFERAGERTTGSNAKHKWFIGFTEYFTYPITKLPTLKRFELAGTKPNGKY